MEIQTYLQKNNAWNAQRSWHHVKFSKDHQVCNAPELQNSALRLHHYSPHPGLCENYNSSTAVSQTLPIPIETPSSIYYEIEHTEEYEFHFRERRWEMLTTIYGLDSPETNFEAYSIFNMENRLEEDSDSDYISIVREDISDNDIFELEL
jgi:hypothetical protein